MRLFASMLLLLAFVSPEVLAAKRTDLSSPTVVVKAAVAKPRTVAPTLVPGECWGNVCAACAEVYYSDGTSSTECRWNDVYGGCGCTGRLRDGICRQSGICHFQQ
jgi:hypothetical protein